MGGPVLVECPCGIVANIKQFPMYCACGRVHREKQQDGAKVVVGVGAELRKMLGCSCRFATALWDEWGPEKCRAAFDDIVQEIVDKSSKRNPVISKKAAEQFLRMAIDKVAAVASGSSTS